MRSAFAPLAAFAVLLKHTVAIAVEPIQVPSPNAWCRKPATKAMHPSHGARTHARTIIIPTHPHTVGHLCLYIPAHPLP